MCVLFNTKGEPRLVIFVGANRHTNLLVSIRKFYPLNAVQLEVKEDKAELDF